MRRTAVAASIALLVLVSCRSNKPKEAPPPPPDPKDIPATIDRIARDVLAESGVPSASVAAVSDGKVIYVQAYGKATWDHAPKSPITAADVRVAAPEAEAELAVGFFGSRYERATPAEREYMRTMASLSPSPSDESQAAVPTADIAKSLGRRPASLSPARDALIKKGLIYSGERGTVAFTVPHFGRYLRSQPVSD